MLDVLRTRDARFLLVGELISLVGDRALMVALPFFVYDKTGSTLATAALVLAFYLPGLLFSSFSGVLADRLDRKRVLVVSHLLQAGVILALLLVPHPGWMWIAYVVMFAELTIATLVTPTAGALLPSLVNDEHLPQANALFGMSVTTARVAGPLVGAALVGWTGLHGVILFDSVTFLLAALLFARLTPRPRALRDATDTRASLLTSWRDMGREWRQGVRHVTASPALRVLFVTMNVTSLGGCLIDPFFVPWVKDRLGAGPQEIGLLSTTLAVGALLGGTMAGRIARKLTPKTAVGLVTMLVGAMMIVVYQQTRFEVALALLFFMGLPLVVSNVAAATLLQRVTPDAYRGRVYGALGTTNALMGVTAVLVGGTLGELVGVVPMLTAAGAITVVGGLVGYRWLPSSSEQAAPAEREVPTASEAAPSTS
ncbi:NRE family putative nickel resistance protein-like MFS transporter [Deinococcus yavapaiensis KR-236]|uniref:NRE family putative nickel resistance protein-like MFS transporter n=2 Tax=Deinococcus TaxID=1298 RepID=A0A318S9W9_9DEIO|nr:NRE family putative nickel resistance protein-like MFS transporter [Deinococcus yavapaiensis KR-236]